MGERVPVLVASLPTEGAYIGRLLTHLDRSQVEPVVVINGLDEYPDDTTRVVEEFGITPLRQGVPDKLTAIQTGLRSLGGKALETLLMTDVDCRPKNTHVWAPTLIAGLDPNKPSAVTGLVLGTDTDIVTRMLRNHRRRTRIRDVVAAGSTSMVSGANMALRLQTEEMLEAILGMAPTWPGEDIAMVDEIRKRGADFTQLASEESAVLASERYRDPLWRRIFIGEAGMLENGRQGYIARAGIARRGYLNGEWIYYDESGAAAANQPLHN